MEENDDLEEVDIDNLVDLIKYVETATKQEIEELLKFMVDMRVQREEERKEQPLPKN